MADTRLTDKTELTAPVAADKIEVIDVSDTTGNAAGTTKWMTWTTIKSYFLKYTGLSDVLDTSLVGKEGKVPMVDTGVGLTPKLKLTKIPTFADIHAGNAIIRGGIIHISGLTYNIWATSYMINNIYYDVPISTNVTLSDGDATNPRIDVFIIRINALVSPAIPSVHVLEGTPAASPVKPTVNLTTEVEVSFRTILATETTDPDITTELIYNEAAGEPTEWGNTYLLAGGDLSDTSDPYLSTVSLKIPATSNDYVSWTNLTDITYASTKDLVFAIKLSAWTPGQSINIKLIDTSSSEYRLLALNSQNASQYGIDTTDTDWQLVQIPLVKFVNSTFSNTFDRLEITFIGTAIMYFDWINIQSGLTQPPADLYTKEVTAGTGIEIDTTDPERPIVSLSGSNIVTEKVSLSAAQLKAVGTSPVVSIAAPGAGKYLRITNVDWHLTWGSVAFDNNAISANIIGGGGAGFSVSSFLDSTADNFKSSTIPTPTDNDRVENAGIRIAGTDSAANGDSTVDAYITYEIITM